MDVLQNHSRLVVTKRQCLSLSGFEHRMAGRTVRSLVTILSYPAQEQCDLRNNSLSALLLTAGHCMSTK